MHVTENLHKNDKSDKNYDLVSIIMPNYNSEKYIKQTICSVLAQTYKNWELLFVDDCSSDSSVELVKTFQDKRIRIFYTSKNSGAAVARNIAIKAAQGKWIAFLDSDDLWLPEKLEKQIHYMESNNFSFTYTDYNVIDENNKIISTFKPKKSICTYSDVLKHNCIGCLTVIYDSSKLGKIFMPTNAVKREDMACWLDILKKVEKAYCLHECLANYKRHSNSVSSNKIKMLKYQWLVYRKVENINILKSFYYIIHWAIMGVFKYK